MQFVDERGPIALSLRSSCVVVKRPSGPFSPPLRSYGLTGVHLADSRRVHSSLLKTLSSFDAEGFGTAFSRLHDAFVLMNGSNGQRTQRGRCDRAYSHQGLPVAQRTQAACMARTAFWPTNDSASLFGHTRSVV